MATTPDTAHALRPQSPANPKPYCVCGQPWPCARDVTDPIAACLGAWRFFVERTNEIATERTPISAAVPRLVAAVERALEVAARHEHNCLRWQDPLPVPSWIPELRQAIAGELLSKEASR
jgi:hypothetical protein